MKLLWESGVYETKDQAMNNDNYRYGCYRTLHIWLYGKKKGGRVCLPSCLVNYIRDLFPDDNYTGFVNRSPIFKRKIRK